MMERLERNDPMTKEEDKEIVLDQEMSASEVARSKGAMLRKKLEQALKNRGTVKASAPRSPGDDLFSSNVGDQDSEGITPDEMKTPFPELTSSYESKMNSTMFGLPSLGDSEVSEAGLEQPSRVDTRMVAAGDLPSDLLRVDEPSDEWELEQIEPFADREFDEAFEQPTVNAEAAYAINAVHDSGDSLLMSSGSHSAGLMLAESESEWSIDDIDLNGELPGEAPEPPPFEVVLPSLGPAPADAEMGGPGVYIHRKSGSAKLRGGSGLHKLSQADVDELFTSSAPGLRSPAGARPMHRTPGALRMSPAQMAASVAGVADASDASADGTLECSFMFSRGGEPVSSIAVDDGFVTALIQFAFDYAARER